MILNEALRVTIIGVIVGLGAGFLLTEFLRTMLFELKPNDPIAIASAALLLLLVSLTSALVPALRASRLEPTEALRYE
jgi:ABC-type antimicrobial peptide transport system permease subunit